MSLSVRVIAVESALADAMANDDPAEVTEKSLASSVVTLTASSNVIKIVFSPAFAVIESTAGALESITIADVAAKSPSEPKSGNVRMAEFPYRSSIDPTSADVVA